MASIDDMVPRNSAAHREEEPTPSPFSEYDGMNADKLWLAYENFHKINPKSRINKPQERERNLKNIRNKLTDIVKGELGEDDEVKRTNLDHLGDEDAKKNVAGDMIQKLVYKAHKARYGEKVGIPDDQIIRNYVNEALGRMGISYDDLVKQIMDSPDLHEEMENTGTALYRLIDFVTRESHVETKKIDLLVETMSRPEHLEGIRNAAGKSLNTKFGPSATLNHVLTEYRTHIAAKNTEYHGAGARKKTYAGPVPQEEPAHYHRAA